MSYCAKCGAKLDEDAKFCSACGAPVAKTFTEEISVSSDNLIEKVKEILHEGNVTSIAIKNEEGTVLLDIPATAGGVFFFFARSWLEGLDALGVLPTNCIIAVERR